MGFPRTAKMVKLNSPVLISFNCKHAFNAGNQIGDEGKGARRKGFVVDNAKSENKSDTSNFKNESSETRARA